MDEEIQAIERNKTWELVNLPKGCKAIGVKWVYKLKKDTKGNIVKHKARLVVKGYNQRLGIDYNEVFAPVARMETVRLLVAIAAQFHWELFQMDFKSAFLNGVLQEDVYVEQPLGYAVQGCEHQVLKLRKALYGLKQAPRTWNATLDVFLRDEAGFVRCPHEYAIYVKQNKGSLLILCVYVDDIIITGNDSALITVFKQSLVKRFEMTDLGMMSYYLGIQVEQREDGILLSRARVHQESLWNRFGMWSCRLVSTPVLVGIKLSKAGNGHLADPSLYRSLVGSLRYVTCTRPDILYAVGLVCRFMETPTTEHLATCERILRYLKGTFAYGLWYASSSPATVSVAPVLLPDSPPSFVLSGYSDSDWGGDVDGRKSTTGFLFFFGAAVFTWVSKLQPIVTLSSTEAEYVAVASCVQHGLWLRQLLKELYMEQAMSTVVNVDNQSAIAVAKNPVYHDRSKHIDVRFHFLREAITKGDVELAYVKTQFQLADLLTKPLGYQCFVKMRNMLGLIDSSLGGAFVRTKLE
ncbi:hypothetical protein Dimus_039054 [Dionaea muscipula]